MISFRELTAHDNLDDLIALSRKFFAEYAIHHKEFFRINRLTRKNICDYFFSFLGTKNGAAFIAIDKGRIVGYIAVSVRRQADYWKIRRVGVISGFMVCKDYRRKGIGTGLIARAVAFFERKSIKYFTTYTAFANKVAVRFFKRNGMKPLQITLVGETGIEAKTG